VAIEIWMLAYLVSPRDRGRLDLRNSP